MSEPTALIRGKFSKFPDHVWYRTKRGKWASREPTAEDLARRAQV